MSLGLGAKALIRMPKPACTINNLEPKTEAIVKAVPPEATTIAVVIAATTTALKIPLKLRPIRILPN